MHPGRQRDAGHQPNPLCGIEIRRGQRLVVAVVAFGPGDLEQRLLSGSPQNRGPGRRREQAAAAFLRGRGNDHGGTGPLQDLALGAHKHDIPCTVAFGMAQRGHVDRDERPVTSRRERMNSPRDQFLARA